MINYLRPSYFSESKNRVVSYLTYICYVSREMTLLLGVHNKLSSNIKYHRVSHCICCTVDGVWSDWSSWEPCSKTCGSGKQRRVRTCPKSRSASGGQNCTGVSGETRSCRGIPCRGEVKKRRGLLCIAGVAYHLSKQLMCHLHPM